MQNITEGNLLGTLYDLATGDEDSRVCKDIPERSCNDQPHNFFTYLGSNVFSRIADALCSAKLVFPWLIGVFHSGARLGRKTYLVDMATSDNRSTYVAVSNTLIGIFLLAGGAIGALGDLVSIEFVIAVLGAIGIAGALYTLRLENVSGG